MRRKSINPFTQPITSDLVTIIENFVRQDPKQTFPVIHQLSCQQHLFFAQWAQARWDIGTINAVVDIMKRYELNDLQFHGKTIYVVTMMLQYGVDIKIFSRDEDGLKSLIETTLRILLQYHPYHSCLILLKLLVEKFEVTPKLIFDIGESAEQHMSL
ncbi:hypothetical protein EON65_12795 [archaeon]|nr:MAG: hypothetical protein EON65_12795 [archaeon]